MSKRNARGAMVRAVSAALAAGSLGMSASIVQAASYTWNTSNNAFNVAANWTPGGGPPGAADTANFTSSPSPSYAVTFTANTTNAAANVTSGQVLWRADATSRSYSLSGLIVSGGSLGLVAGLGSPSSLFLSLGNNPVQVSGGASFTVGVNNDLDCGNISIGTASVGSMTVDGSGSTVYQQSGSLFTLGTTFGGSSSLTVTNSGLLQTGGGLTTINPTGSVLLQSGAFYVMGNLNVSGGTITQTGGAFAIPAGRTTNIVSGGKVNVIGFNFPNASIMNVSDLGSQFNNNSGDLTLPTGGQINITNGATFTTPGYMDVTGDNATRMIIDGPGSALMVNGGAQSFLGYSGTTGTVIVRNGGLLNIPGGYSMGGTGSGALNVESNAVANVGSVSLFPNGVVTVNGGTLNLGTASLGGGSLAFLNGTVNYGGNLTIEPTGLLGPNLNLASNRTLAVALTTTINSGQTLTINGGSFSTGSLVNNGTFNFSSGTLGITGAGGLAIAAGGPIGSNVSIGGGQTLKVSNALAVSSGATLNISGTGLVNAGASSSNAGTITMAGGSIAASGFFNHTGSLSGYGTMTTGSTLSNSGSITAKNGNLIISSANFFQLGALQNQPGTNISISTAPMSSMGQVTVNAAGSIVYNITGSNPNISAATGDTIRLRGGVMSIPQALTLFGSAAFNGYGQFNGNLVTQSNSPIDFYGPTIIEGNLLIFGASNSMTVRSAQTEVTGSTSNNGSINVQSGGKFVSLGGIIGNPPTSSLTVDPGSEILASFLQQGALSIGGSAGSPGLVTIRKRSEGADTSVLNALTVTGGASPLGKMDLKDTQMIVRTGGAGSWTGSGYTSVTGLIKSGRNSGNWSGNGIVTSMSAANNSNFTTLGVALASDIRSSTATATSLWAGQTITGSDTLVMYTYGGDANLDGKLNIDDYVRIDQGIAAQLTGWSNGDFNYDGKVNIDDYTTVIDSNIGNQNGFVFPTATGGPASAGPLVSAIPEPAGLFVLIPLGFSLRARRRRSP